VPLLNKDAIVNAKGRAQALPITGKVYEIGTTSFAAMDEAESIR